MARKKNKKFAAETAEERRERLAHANKLVRECRERERKHLSLHHVAIDGEMLNLLVREGYLEDAQTDDWDMVNAGLFKFLWRLSHPK